VRFKKITVFTSNQPRHVSLIETLCRVAEEVYAVQECNTLFPGSVADFYKKSDVMQRYFQKVLAAEEEIFGETRFSNANARTLSMKVGDLNQVNMSILAPALKSDLYIVFGASYIKRPLIDFLVAQKALNIHMGISPYYRGNSCNFWALFDGRPDYVGSTIHLLSRGLDSGPMLFHALPNPRAVDGFALGMHAVKAAHEGLASFIEQVQRGESNFNAVEQDRSKELRYTKNSHFDDAVASQYLASTLTPDQILEKLKAADQSKYLCPFFY
jgi:folate-dependent phosphoribosylglycinamide formyltransferase PurN